MAEPVYAAYLSYSHQDTAWATWIHRAIEGYRVPRRLVGEPGENGPVPARLSPVFRDREDLSSASNLNDRLVEALAASRFLIVVCSPNAADSRWVNEEIRRFRELHGADRILCLLVDGEAGGEPSPFPAALLEGGDREPLAADPRSWADGKTLARQKIIAGMLGVRLDVLRQRDLRRRRLWQAGATAAVVLGIILTFTAVTSRMAEQQERQRAEEMAGFIVDLGERLKTDLDLESQAMISRQALTYLESLDPDDLSRGTSVKVGLALRQLGQVSGGQGDQAQALQALEESRDLFAALHDRFPDDPDALFELSQAEFWLGYHYIQGGRSEQAGPFMQAYLDMSQELLAMDPSNPAWLLESSYAATGMLAWRLEEGQAVDDAMLNEARAAIKLAERAKEAKDRSLEVLLQYATTLAWAADAHREACRLDEALAYREVNLRTAQEAARGDPTNFDLAQVRAFAHSGVATMNQLVGRPADALAQWQQSVELLEGFQRRDPSNVVLARDVLLRRFSVATLEAEAAPTPERLAVLGEIEDAFHDTMAERDSSPRLLREVIAMRLTRSELALQAGDGLEASRQLERALEAMLTLRGLSDLEDAGIRLAPRLRYQWWRQHGTDLAGTHPELGRLEPPSRGPYRGCDDAFDAARLAVIRGDRDEALRQADYLASRGFAPPDYRRFCEFHDLCGGNPPAQGAHTTHPEGYSPP